ncbi:MAG: LacI family DNA-binding transcriptional regulator [Spirochaetales bacterium]
MIRIQLKQIAEEAQVSTTLVSQVLNKRDVRVAAETRERILRIAERYHYLPNRLAAGLKLKRTNTIAVLVPFTSAGFFSELIYHIEAYAMERGFNSLVINTFGERDKETKGLQLYKSQLADGFLVAPQNAQQHQPLFDQLQADQFPFVFVDRFVDNVSATTVSSDHFSVACDLTQKLIAKGHRNILFVRRLNEPENSTIRSRMDGYKQTMESCGLAAEFGGFIFDGDTLSNLNERLFGFPHAGAQPDAIFLASGFYMPLLLRLCSQLSYSIEKIDFATVDWFMFPADFLKERDILGRIDGNLHLVVQDTERIAKQAMDILIDLIDGKKDSREQKHIPVTWSQL